MKSLFNMPIITLALCINADNGTGFIERISENLLRFIRRGQNEGYIVQTSAEIITAVFISSLRAVFNDEFTSKTSLSMKQIGESLLEMFLNSILTDKGKILFKELKTEQL